jgi:tetratricopeptide (TPR) repeat protein
MKNYQNMSLEWIRDVNLNDYKKNIKEHRAYLTQYCQAKDSKRWELYNELAVLDIFDGKYSDAKRKLFQAANLKGFNYSVSSNLGVVYELMGNNDSALYYVKRAMTLEPSSHRRSEWIHLKLLEAKLKDADWVYTNSIITINKESNNFSSGTVTTEEGEMSIDRLIDQIDYQLHERMIFVKPKDKYVANLLVTLGRLYSLKYDNGNADNVFRMAIEYDDQFKEQSEKFNLDYLPLKRYEKIIKDAHHINDSMQLFLITSKSKFQQSMHRKANTKIESDYTNSVLLRKRLRVYVPIVIISVSILCLFVFIRLKFKK